MKSDGSEEHAKNLGKVYFLSNEFGSIRGSGKFLRKDPLVFETTIPLNVPIATLINVGITVTFSKI
ncbi:hypothetical protein SDC9_142497 [bioreactor metagenome]|uniref:Uncharacterized protein n=1 Tax=bioreactor metagenome TaxID=1076179 RepID=A0A645E3F7_9ZZZZ